MNRKFLKVNGIPAVREQKWELTGEKQTKLMGPRVQQLGRGTSENTHIWRCHNKTHYFAFQLSKQLKNKKKQNEGLSSYIVQTLNFYEQNGFSCNLE